MTADKIVFYDIAMAPPRARNVCSPNPWKTRLALNLKRVPYSTIWVPLPSIAAMRRGLGVPPCRKFSDGADFYTLPVLDDAGTLLGDSFDIAVHLARRPGPELFPDLGPLLDFKLGDLPLLVPLTDCSGGPYPSYAAFNMAVDAAFTAHTGLATFGFPFDPDTRALTQAEFVRRASGAGITSWAEFALEGARRAQTLASFEKTLGGLAELYAKTEGAFLGGKVPSYADCIVDAWLQMFAVTLPAAEWEAVRGWHEGTFGRLFDALEPYKAVDEGTDWVEA